MKKKLLFLGLLLISGMNLFAAQAEEVNLAIVAPVEEEKACVICWDSKLKLSREKKPLVMLPCSHELCHPCFVKMLSFQNDASKCPCCRKIFDKSELSAADKELNRQIFLKEKYRLNVIQRDTLSLIRKKAIGCLFVGMSLLMYVSDESEYYQYCAGLGTGIAVLGGSFLVSSQEITKKILCDNYPGIVNIVDQGMRNGFNQIEDPIPTLQLENPIPDL
ncbi:hypothetical protein K9K77_03415 [Candidatus Babeliales bacterium]|nr:hypothetical protein [Candidatus Babeliales bacterium]